MVQMADPFALTLKFMDVLLKGRAGWILLGLMTMLGLYFWSKRPPKRSPLQLADEGHGPLIYRKYWLDFQSQDRDARDIFERIKQDVPAFCPSLLADFKKIRGKEQVLKVGDEYDIRIFGPWNGRVRVVEVQETSFTLATLRPHPEAGQIVFELEKLDEAFRFSISSQARSRDALVHLAYSFLGGNKVQEKAWQTFCERVAEEGGGETLGAFQSETIEVPSSPVKAGEVA